MRMLKRLIDIVLALIGILLTLPFLPLIALLIKIDSRGPVFYRCDRIGKDMKTFKMFKLRTMLDMPVNVGESVSPLMDPRVSSFGRFLRRTKLNEMPQFINILMGDMSFVGPRPEAPDLAELYPENARTIFSVKPGLVGPNQIIPAGRNEEELYPPGVDVKKYYIEEILPAKVKRDLEYIGNTTLFKDFKYILGGVKETVASALTMRHIRENSSQIWLFVADSTISVLCFILAEEISANHFGSKFPGHMLRFIPVLIVVRSSCFFAVGMYNSLIRHISYQEMFRILRGVSLGTILFTAMYLKFHTTVYAGLPLFMDWTSLVLLLSFMRFGLKLRTENSHSKKELENATCVLIFGADSKGDLAYRALISDTDRSYRVVGFIDDDTEKYGKRLNGLKVLGNRHHIQALSQLHNVGEIILALPHNQPDQMAEIVNICRKADLRYRIFSPIREFEEDFLEQLIPQIGCRRPSTPEYDDSYLAGAVSNLLSFLPKETIVHLLLNTCCIEPLKTVPATGTMIDFPGRPYPSASGLPEKAGNRHNKQNGS